MSAINTVAPSLTKRIVVSRPMPLSRLSFAQIDADYIRKCDHIMLEIEPWLGRTIVDRCGRHDGASRGQDIDLVINLNVIRDNTYPAAPVMIAFLPSNLPSFLCILSTSGFRVSRGRDVESYA
jgi:hypothetical protein